MMRVAYICADSGIPVFGCKGASIHVQSILRCLSDLGAQVTLFSNRIDGKAPEGLGEIKQIRLAKRPSRSSLSHDEFQLLTANELRREQDSYGRFDLIYERYALWSCSAMEFARDEATPSILEINAPLIHEQKKFRQLENEAIAIQISDRAIDAATSIITVSEEVARCFRHSSTRRNKIHVIPNGVDVDRFEPRLESSIGGRAANHSRGACPDRPVIGFVGTLKPWHGVEGLIAAFAEVRRQLPTASLRIVGDGPEWDRLHEQVAKLETDTARAIEFVGAVEPDEIPATLSTLDVAVAPYPLISDFYFSPLKIMEYMAASLPVVASRIGQVAEIITHGKTGWLYQPDDIGGLVESLITVLDDRNLANRLGQAARSEMVRDYSWSTVLQRTLATLPIKVLDVVESGASDG